MSDLIDRKIAVQGVRELFSMGDCYCDKLSIVGMLNGLPSAEPEQKKGKWIYDTERVMNNGGIYSQYHCSECGFQSVSHMNFCPYCGADMRGE